MSASSITWDNRVVWRNGKSVMFTLPNAWDKGEMFHVGMLGPFPTDHNFYGSSPEITFEDAMLPPNNFQGEISGGYINVYSSLSLKDCHAWLQGRLGESSREYKVKVDRIGRPFLLPFRSPVCQACHGLHSDLIRPELIHPFHCPFVPEDVL
ncbi:hypothetical protein BT96DRAFT_1027675 [Gymnopus androsaceus JB14]|uniref:Uncharacterized protein n=1 Tax=Gymnopus androsaceus JB14 TaxID=1447944 RepID=A0A6A4GA69_9AGAR|nr:hypothetical protein BT96DRAFT_1027675 [Gymnopus androsaceus JB14]